MIAILKHFIGSVEWIWLVYVICWAAIGFLADQQFNNAKVTDRTRWYQFYSSAWHILAEVMLFWTFSMFCMDNLQYPWFIPAGVTGWILLTFRMALIQMKRDPENRTIWYFGDGKGPLSEHLCDWSARLINWLFKTDCATVSNVSIFLRAGLWAGSIVLCLGLYIGFI